LGSISQVAVDYGKVKQMFISYYGFVSDNIRIILDDDNDIASIMVKEMFKLVDNATKRDIIFCYFSGHG